MQTTRRPDILSVVGVLIFGSAALFALGASGKAMGGTPTARSVLAKAPGGELLDEVDAVDKMGRAGDAVLVELLDYYIGEGPTVLLDEAITRRGKRMLPALTHARKRTPHCLQEFIDKCLDRTPELLGLRQERVGTLIDAIQRGKILCAEDDNCPSNK